MEHTGFFKEDASLSVQYWETFAKSGDIQPEKRLFAAVLDDAVKSYRKLLVVRGRRFVEEETWLFSNDKNATFSFCNVCEVLGLDPDRVRKSLRKPAPNLPALPAAELPRPAHRVPYRRAGKATAALLRA